MYIFDNYNIFDVYIFDVYTLITIEYSMYIYVDNYNIQCTYMLITIIFNVYMLIIIEYSMYIY